MNQKNRRFNTRVLTSLTVTVSFLCLAVSGIVLYFTPKGRVAHWTGWTMLGLEKEEWAGVHTMLAILFVVASGVHIYFNWQPLLRYFKDAVSKGIKNRAELAAAVLITLVFFVGALRMWPPFGTVLHWGEQIKYYWERSSAAAPYAHAEESTLAEFAENVGISPGELEEQLTAKGFEVSDLSVTVGDLARKHRMSPSEVFEALPRVHSAPRRGLLPGGGYGQKTLRQVCDETGIELEQAVAVLEKRGIGASGSDSIRSLAAQTGMRPRELVDLLKTQQ